VKQNKARILLDGQGLMSGLSCDVATERAIVEKRDLLRIFSNRLEKALRWGLANVDAYATAWANETGVPYGVSRQTLLARGFTPAPIDARTHDRGPTAHRGCLFPRGSPAGPRRCRCRV